MFSDNGLLGLAIALAAFIMALVLRRRLREIEARLDSLERRLPEGAQVGFEAPAPSPAPDGGAATLSADAETPAPQPMAETPEAPVEIPAAEDAEAAAPPPPPPPPLPQPPPRGFEERFGTSWVVWAGGIALALGGIFLVQYSIERGLLGPVARIFLGALLAAALVLAGEWMRRSEQRSDIMGLPSAHIPSILTAAGTTVA